MATRVTPWSRASSPRMYRAGLAGENQEDGLERVFGCVLVAQMRRLTPSTIGPAARPGSRRPPRPPHRGPSGRFGSGRCRIARRSSLQRERGMTAASAFRDVAAAWETPPREPMRRSALRPAPTHSMRRDRRSIRYFLAERRPRAEKAAGHRFLGMSGRELALTHCNEKGQVRQSGCDGDQGEHREVVKLKRHRTAPESIAVIEIATAAETYR